MTSQGDPSDPRKHKEADGGEAAVRSPSKPRPRPAATSGEAAVVALRMEDLTLCVMERVARMPRAHKFTLGERLVETCLEITCALVDATYTRGRRALLASASRALTRARVLVRLGRRLGATSDKQAAYFAEQSNEVGKMLGGWARAAARAIPASTP
ncbi:MAG: four helix bundle protein [Polyangiaceae bacterium]|nr:four helix bundle protein [Polyangiaceae bacterium]